MKFKKLLSFVAAAAMTITALTTSLSASIIGASAVDEVLPDSGSWQGTSNKNGSQLMLVNNVTKVISALGGATEFYITFDVTGVDENSAAYLLYNISGGTSNWNVSSVCPLTATPTDGTYTVKYSGAALVDSPKFSFLGVGFVDTSKNNASKTIQSVSLKSVTLTDPNAGSGSDSDNKVTITDFTGSTTFVDSTDRAYQAGDFVELMINDTSKGTSILSDEQKAKITAMADSIKTITYEIEVTGTIASPFTLLPCVNAGTWSIARGSNPGGMYINNWNCTIDKVQVTGAGTYTVTTTVKDGLSSSAILNNMWFLTSLEYHSWSFNPDAVLTLKSLTIEGEATEAPIDYTALDAAIADGEAVDTTKYTEDSAKALTDAIAAAKTVKANADATQADVDAAAQAITDAIDALVEKPEPAPSKDYYCWKGKWTKGVNSLTTSGTIGGVAAECISGGWQIKITNADISGMVDPVIVIDNGGVNKIQLWKGSGTGTYIKNGFNSGTPLQLADKTVSTYTISMNANGSVTSVLIYDAAAGEPTIPIFYTALDKAITDGEAVDTTKYTDDSAKALTDAITAAKAVKENTSATQDDVDAAAKAITDAIDALVEKPEPAPSKDYYCWKGKWTKGVNSLTTSGTIGGVAAECISGGWQIKITNADISGMVDPVIVIDNGGVNKIQLWKGSGTGTYIKNGFNSGTPLQLADKTVSTYTISMNANGSVTSVLIYDAAAGEPTIPIFYTALDAAIADGEAVDTTKYTEDSAKALTDAITAAKAVKENTSATQDDVDAAAKAITDAIAALVEKPEPAPEGTLKITDFAGSTTFVDSTDRAYQAGDFVELMINDTSRGTSILSDEQKAKITAMADSIKTITYEIEVTGTIASPFTLLPCVNAGTWSIARGSNPGGMYINNWNCTIDKVQVTGAGTYTVTTTVKDGLSSSAILNNMWFLTSLEYHSWSFNPDAVLTLKSLTIEGESSEAPSLDYTALDAAIADGEAIDSSKYTAESYAVLTAALGTAKTVKANADATQADVDAVAQAVTDAIKGLVNASANPINYTVLNTAIAAGEAVDTTKYTDDSVKTLTDAITAAKAVKENADATQADVDAAAKAVTDAIAGLVVKPVENPVLTVYLNDYSTGDEKITLKATVDINVTGDYTATISGINSSYLYYHIGGFAYNGTEQYVIDVNSITVNTGTNTYELVPTRGNLNIVPGEMKKENGMQYGFSSSDVLAKNADETVKLMPFGSGSCRLLVNGRMTDIKSFTYNFSVKDILTVVEADKTVLKAELEKAKAIDSTLYTASTYKAVADAVAAGDVLVADKMATQDSVDAAAKAIADAIAGLTESPKVDPATEPFEYIYYHQIQAYTSLLSGTAGDDIAGANKIRFTFDCAGNVSYNPNASIEFKAVVGGTETGYNKFLGTDGSYKAGTTGWMETLSLSKAIEAGDSYELIGFTAAWEKITDYVYGVTRIEFIGSNGKVLKTITSLPVNFTALDKAIADGEAIDATKYTDESVKALTDAITAAKAVKENADATQGDVDAAAKAITDAIAALELKPVVVTTGTVTGKIIVSDSNAETEITVTATAADGTETIVKATSMGEYVLENLAVGEYTLTISGGKYVERTYEITVTEGSIAQEVKLNPIGDINGDGKVTTADVGMANSHAKGVKTLTDYDFACGDVNRDGKISTADVGMINSHAKGVKTLW